MRTTGFYCSGDACQHSFLCDPKNASQEAALTLTEGSRHGVALRVNYIIMSINGATQRHLGNKEDSTENQTFQDVNPRRCERKPPLHLVNKVVLCDHSGRFPWIAIDLEAPPTYTKHH